MKLTLVGTPDTVTEHDGYITFSMSGKAPSSLPKGLPPLPDGPPMTWTVWLSTRQWNRINGHLDNPDEKLIIEGFPCLRGSEPVLIAIGAKSLLQDRAKQEAARAARETAPLS
jgi:hypothetical protein